MSHDFIQVFGLSCYVVNVCFAFVAYHHLSALLDSLPTTLIVQVEQLVYGVCVCARARARVCV